MAGRRLMDAPFVSIAVPCYRQLEPAKRCIATILAQSFRDFDLTLTDDGASDEYRAYVESLGDPRVRYVRNAMRLGAMKNMFGAIAAGRAKYTLAFHEDDLLAEGYLAAAVGILERQPACGFVAAELREFRDEPPPADLARVAASPAHEVFSTGADFLRAVFRGLEPMFGSIVYRRDAIAGVEPELTHYGTLADRPYLLSIMRRWSAAIVREPLAWYRAHLHEDGRHQAMTVEHILRLFRTYRSTLPPVLNARDQALFFSYSGYWLIALYHLVPARARPSLRSFLFQAWREGLYDPRWRGRSGYKQALKAVLGVGARTHA
jgi:glycosyltransferase involved in cell wall biosynthesis